MSSIKMRVILFFIATLVTLPVVSQVEKLVVDEAYRTEAGITYRVYAQMKNVGDQVLAVFGDSAHVLKISSTKPFFQNRYGGSLSIHVKRNMLEVRDSLKYDSWLTIGATDNYENNLKVLGLELTAFEKSGSEIVSKDGAWYCLPIDKQSVCAEDKRILILQLTTQGEISGNLSIMGRSVAKENFQLYNLSFQSP